MSVSAQYDGITTGIIVGIDIGMTYTGVAICAYDGKGHRGPRAIQEWPEKDEKASKVPTRIAYRAGFGRLHSWGFSCPDLGDIGKGIAIFDLFKFQLQHIIGGKEVRQGGVKVEIKDVKNWYRDYLGALYVHIEEHLKRRWNVDFERGAVRVDYIFSIPTSWKDNQELVGAFRQVVDEAGFRLGNVTMELTEGEAAAVFSATMLDHKLQEGEAFIVCDAGGQTTDMCALQVVKVVGDAVQLELLDDPKAIHVGSVCIDDLFEKRAKEYLSKLKIDGDLDLLAHRMRNGDFQPLKVKFGTGLELEIMKLRVRDNALELMGSNASMDPTELMDLSKNELKGMFDIQIEKIIEFIDNQIKLLCHLEPEIKLSYIFLAGGLGSSRYLQEKIVGHYKDIRVLFAKDRNDLPLAVCKGLVMDRLQHFSNLGSVIPIKSSSASYGILCCEAYGKKHLGQTSVRNPIDGNRYAVNQIDWLVVRGRVSVGGDTVKRKYLRVVEYDNRTDRWGFAVVWSRMAPEKLPLRWELHGGAAIICYVVWEPEAGTRHVSAMKKRKFFVKKYWLVEYELTAVLTLGQLRFSSKIIGQVADEDEEDDLQVQWPSGIEESKIRYDLIRGDD